MSKYAFALQILAWLFIAYVIYLIIRYFISLKKMNRLSYYSLNLENKKELLTFEQADDLVEFPNRVKCKTKEVYEDGKIYLDECTVDGHKTKATYGTKQEVQEEVADVIEDGSFYVYEKDGFGSDFTIEIKADGTFNYYEGLLSSHIGMGEWSYSDGMLTLFEKTSRLNEAYELEEVINSYSFSVEKDTLIFVDKGLDMDLDNFLYVKVKHGEKFFVQ